MSHQLPLPPHFQPKHASEWSYRPDIAALAASAPAWRQAHSISPAAEDSRRVHLLLIDTQRDFCFPEGTLYVGGRDGQGAVRDNDRIAQFIYRNLGIITDITATFDTHQLYHIFFPWFWQTASGEQPSAHTMITHEDVVEGRYRPDPALAAGLTDGDVAQLTAHALHYTRRLAEQGNYTLYLWPPHCLIGTEGHAQVGVIDEARHFHGLVRASQPVNEIKGLHPLTENYSVFSAEVSVSHDGRALSPTNDALFDTLLAADALIVAGQAGSHCVKNSLDDLRREIHKRDARLANKVYVLEDGMSAVVAPSLDFTAHMEASLAACLDAGMHIVKSTEPCEDWPAFP